MEEKRRIGLCYRCEFRAEHLETGRTLRFECGNDKSSVGSCYAFKPVTAPIVEPNNGDKRPMFSGLAFCARVRAIGLPEVEYLANEVKGGLVVYTKPKSGKENGRTKAKPKRRSTASKTGN